MTPRRIAWAVFLSNVVMMVLAVVFVATASAPELDDANGTVAVNLFLALPFIAVGPLLVARRPGNAIGGLFCSVALLWSLNALAVGWAAWALGRGIQAYEVALWVSNAIFAIPLFIAPILLFLLFPTGRPLTPRWRWVGWALAVVATVGLVGGALRPGDLDGPVPIDNPIALHGTAGDFLVALEGPITAAVGILFVLSAASLILRLRRSRGTERLQIKWVVYLGALAVAAFVSALAVSPIAEYVFPVGIVAVGCIPIAAGLAILRYGLYEIDRVINRTLVYAALTAILAGAYLGSVLVLQALLDPLTSGSGLAVAASTLAVAALFRPLRSRIQQLVDRRFYRRKYDTARTLTGFGARLRDEVDLDALGSELRGVVADTMQPAHVSLWLRNASRTPPA